MRNRPSRPKEAAPRTRTIAPTFSERVYDVVRRIPPGKAASYGDVAALLGSPRAARGVGWALNALDGDSSVPWWRVINRRGAISIRHPDVSPKVQRALLEDEGVAFDGSGCVDWAVVRWVPDELSHQAPRDRAADAMSIKQSVSFVIRHHADPALVLAVRRPPDDDDLPDAWGLPAGSLRGDESDEDAVRRAGRDKLGVELEVGDVLEQGEIERPGHVLRMRLYEATVRRGTPSVPQPSPGVTQYTELDWASPDRFEPAARAGSLCCRLYLRTID